MVTDEEDFDLDDTPMQESVEDLEEEEQFVEDLRRLAANRRFMRGYSRAGLRRRGIRPRRPAIAVINNRENIYSSTTI